LFYVPSISSSTVTITVTLTNGVTGSVQTVPFFGMAVAEYSGTDPNYPLDSISAGYSYSGGTGSALDSGSAAPANPTFMVFGAGIDDATGTALTALPFIIRQSNNTGNCAFIEDSPAGTPAVLQHANASCTASGNWLMQMAVFRSASWTVAGGWSPIRPPDEVNAAQYPGNDICAQAATAAAANPNATILMPISGPMACSVDPTGGYQSSPYNLATPAPAFGGNLRIVATGPGAKLTVSTPWIFANRNMNIDFGNVEIDVGAVWRQNYVRCWTNGSTDTMGDEGQCPLTLGSTFTITANTPTTGCAEITYNGTNSETDPNVIRGGEVINIIGAADPRNNGPLRVIPVNDGICSGIGPTAAKFYVWMPSAQGCTSVSACGSNLILAAQAPMFRMNLRPWDTPTSSSGCTGSGCVPCHQINGKENDTDCNGQGVKLENFGTVLGVGYGIEGVDNSNCQEQCMVNNYRGRAIFRTSMLTFGWWMAASGSQNNNGFRHWEDSCGDPYDNSNCHIRGPYHVGVWGRDSWLHGTIEDVTFNQSMWCGIMLDDMTGDIAGLTIRGIHFQNRVSDLTASNINKAYTYAGGNLGNICIGTQNAASAVLIDQIETNAANAALSNIIISGSNQVPVGNLPPWEAGGQTMTMGAYYPLYAAIKPDHHNGSNNIFIVTAPSTGGISGNNTQEPTWDSGSCGTAGDTCSDGALTWFNVGNTFPNSVGPLNSNNVKAINLTTNSTPTLYNGVTNNSWSDASISDYNYQNDSGSIVECSSSSEHRCRMDQGFSIASQTITVQSGTNCTGSCSQASLCLNSGGGDNQHLLYICTTAGTWSAVAIP